MDDRTPPQGEMPPGSGAAPPGYPAYPYPVPPAQSRGLPIWAIVLIVVGVLAIAAGFLAAIAIPMFVNQNQRAKDSAVKEAVHRLQIGIQTYAVENGDRYPEPADVSPDGALSAYVDDWPENPWTGEPMHPGGEPGDYVYETIAVGMGYNDYSLRGHLHDGTTYVVP